MTKSVRFLLRFVVCPVTAGLAVWQWRRLQWKENLLEDVRKILADESTERIPTEHLLAMPMYKRFHIPREDVVVDWKRCVRVGPYPAYDSSRKKTFTEAVICPCSLGGKSVLMDFGMLTHRGMPLAMIDIDALQTSDWVVTRERSHRASWFWGNRPGDWRTKDIDQLSEHLQTLPVMLQRLKPCKLASLRDNMLVGEGGEEVLARIPNRHLEYVGTWAALCATSLVFSFFV